MIIFDKAVLDKANTMRSLMHDLELAAYFCHIAEMSVLLLIMFLMLFWSRLFSRCIWKFSDSLRGGTEFQTPTKMIRISQLQYKFFDECASNAIVDRLTDPQVVVQSPIRDGDFDFSITVETPPAENLDSTEHDFLESDAEKFVVLRSEHPPGTGGEDSCDADSLCIVCTERAPDAILVNCGHRFRPSSQIASSIPIHCASGVVSKAAPPPAFSALCIIDPYPTERPECPQTATPSHPTTRARTTTSLPAAAIDASAPWMGSAAARKIFGSFAAVSLLCSSVAPPSE
jgi:hypothetical protein